MAVPLQLHFRRTSVLLSLPVVLCVCSQASAQFGGNRINRPIDTPAYSPYLNMLRNDGSGPVQNYFGLVRPQQEFTQQNQQLGLGLQTLQMQQMQGMQQMPGTGVYGYSQLGTTGHPVMFNSFRTGQFSGGFTGIGSGMAGGGMAGGGFGGQAGAVGFGNQSGGMGGSGMGFSGVSGHSSSFGNIIQPGMGMSRGR